MDARRETGVMRAKAKEKEKKQAKNKSENPSGSRVYRGDLRAVSGISENPAGNDNKNNHFNKVNPDSLPTACTRYRDAGNDT